MAYGYHIKKRNDKKIRQMKPHLVFASLAMAAGMLAPFGVAEAEIVRKDGVNAPAIVQNNNVYDIAPEKINGDFAYNRFEKFVLDSGQIANLNSVMALLWLPSWPIL